MPNRQIVNGEPYRYAYQGQEKDPETGKEAFQLRLWDGRIGRWLTTDPKGEFSSPYLGMGNNPIRKIDPDGGETDDIIKVNSDGIITDVIKAPGEDIFILEDGTELFFNDPLGADNIMARGGYSKEDIGSRLFYPLSASDVYSITDKGGLLNYWGYEGIPLSALPQLYYKSHGDWDYTMSYFKANASKYVLYPTDTDEFNSVRRRWSGGVWDIPPVHMMSFRYGNSDVLYNVFDAGNYLWGVSMFRSGFSENLTWFGSNANELFRGGDDAADQRAIFNGYRRYGLR